MEDNDKEPLDELKEFLQRREKEGKNALPECKKPPALPLSERYPHLLLGLQLAVIAAASIYIYAAFPKLTTALTPQKQLRFGSYNTDAAAEACIKNLWKLAAGMETSGKAVCPASALPYKTEGRKISCPAAEKHGLNALYFQPRQGVVAEEGK